MNADPAAALKEISKELQDKFDEAGMGKVEEFVDMIEDVMDKAKKGPGELLKAMQEQIDSLKKSLEDALADPSSLAGGGAAGCIAGWYGGEVAKKLRSFSDETTGLVDEMKKMASNVEKPMKDLADSLQGAVDGLDKCVKSLAKLPKMVTDEISGKDSPDDIAKINTGGMKKALDGGDLDGPLSALGGVKDILGAAIDAIKSGAEFLAGFLSKAPGTVKSAFDLPPPLCALQSVLMSQAPALLTELLGMLDKLEAVSLQPVVDALSKTQSTLGDLNPDAIKDPVNKFMESAKGLVDKLDKTVKGAKMAGGLSALKSPF